MLELRRVLVFILWIVFIECRIEQLVVGGKEVDIDKFPHSVFLSKTCYNVKNNENRSSICGGSIINELVILTAAHCVVCDKNYKLRIVSTFVGHAFFYKGFESTVETISFHPNYTVFYEGYDLVLARLKTRLEYGKNVKRVAIMNEPPYAERAELAGWGLTVDLKIYGGNLKYVEQWVWKRNKCKEVVYWLAPGTICASSGDPYRHVARGDSGSALVVRGYIQIGIVSYAFPSISRSVLVYTDTGFFHDWIVKYAEKLYCASEQ